MTHDQTICLGLAAIGVLFCGGIAAGIAYDRSFSEKADKYCKEYGMSATFTRNKFFCVNEAGQVFDVTVLRQKGTNK